MCLGLKKTPNRSLTGAHSAANSAVEVANGGGGWAARGQHGPVALDTGGGSGSAGSRFHFDFLPETSFVESLAFQFSKRT